MDEVDAERILWCWTQMPSTWCTSTMSTLAVWCWCRTRQVGSRARSCVDAGKTGGHNFQSRFHRHHRHHSITSYYYSLTAINIKLMLENDTHFKSHPNHPKVRSRDCDLLNTQFLVSLPKSKKICFFTNFLCRPQKNWRPVVRLILMPPTFHIVCLNRYTPNFPWVP